MGRLSFRIRRKIELWLEVCSDTIGGVLIWCVLGSSIAHPQSIMPSLRMHIAT